MEEFFGEPISKYTSQQATEDGFLFTCFKHPMFSHITTNLLYKGGYMVKDEKDEDHINMPNVTDLLNQAMQIIRRKPKDWFYSGFIELPSGERQKIFIAQNETGKYTIMLPEDY